MEILYLAMGVVLGAIGVLLRITYNIYKEYKHALWFSENWNYLFQMKSCCIKHDVNGVYVVAELEGVQLSTKRKKEFEDFVRFLMEDYDEFPNSTIPTSVRVKGSAEPFVPKFNTKKLCEGLRCRSDRIQPLVAKYSSLNFVSKLLLWRKYEQLCEQYKKIDSQLYKLQSNKETFVCFF